MGFLKDQFTKFASPLVDEAVAKARLEKADAPYVTEVPTNMQVGYAHTGGARRKYQGTVDFDTLRQFSVVYDVARACINHRKRQIANLEWTVTPKDDQAKPETFKKQIQEITDFFEDPCHAHDFKMLSDKIIEDLLVLDAAVLWKDKTFGGQLKELLPVDATTIRLKVCPDGTTPEPPEVAFEQIIYGKLVGEYTTDEMIYKMLNPRTNTPYGLSPMEGLIIGVDAALRSQLYNASLLSEGTVPEGFFGVPPDWTVDQIKDYQLWFDTMLAGNPAYQSRIKFMPGGKGVGYMPTKSAQDMRFLEFEKWLLLKTCAMFDVQPESIGFIENVTKSTTEGQQQLGNERGLVPLANFLKKMFTRIIRDDFGNPDLKFEWKGLQVVDNEFELERNTRMLQNGALTINEWRTEQGYDPFPDEQADKPMLMSISAPTLLERVGEEPEPVEGETPKAAPKDGGKIALDELEKWETKCLNYEKRGKGLPAFNAEHLERAAQTLIKSRLATAKTRAEVREAFRPFKAELIEKSLVDRALRVEQDITLFTRNKYERTGPRAR
jgi:phage portal protein BeeE